MDKAYFLIWDDTKWQGFREKAHAEFVLEFRKKSTPDTTGVIVEGSIVGLDLLMPGVGRHVRKKAEECQADQHNSPQS